MKQPIERAKLAAKRIKAAVIDICTVDGQAEARIRVTPNDQHTHSTGYDTILTTDAELDAFADGVNMALGRRS